MGSDVYYTYIVDNEFWDLRIRQRTEKEYFALADVFADKLRQGVFAEDLRTQFKHILEYYGQDPFIVRSSSILEDGFGNAFAGKYESVFCANRGTLEERLKEFEDSLKERGINRDVRFISCRGLVKKQIIMNQMQQLMQIIQEEYEHPVDIEFTMNLSENGEYSINLLQCRPLQVFKDTKAISVPDSVPKEGIILESVGATMGLSRSVPIDLIVYVDPKAYYNMPYAEKTRIARIIGKVNWTYREQERHMMLIVPGRIGTSSPELGVPTSFADISEFEAVCEVEEKEAGYNPELSYGSHIFQDLVEADILYTAIFSNDKTLNFAPNKLSDYKNIISDFAEADSDRDIVSVFEMKDTKCTLFYDLEKNHLMLKI